MEEEGAGATEHDYEGTKERGKNGKAKRFGGGSF